ncbi:Glycoside hydrolase family 5 protein [Mycena sanguinolenta]|uniref:Glycoside hydrolase family 5 protein n=1 Tax=Mycena sanguinolenta TaxID=230812 RepID=A0A8H7DE32_9AGAR|nr:Glycoside hydrolase family 5 protein [Mycena sanguinolenta]
MSSIFTAEVLSVLQDAAPILVELGVIPALSHKRTQLITNFMDVNWQFNDPPNPADAANGPQGYDNHLYYVFGGVADPNPTAYLTSICSMSTHPLLLQSPNLSFLDLPRVQNDAALGNSPLWFGEWGLPVQFTTNNTFLTQWADAQKLAYSKGAGWIFWNFKVEKSELAGDLGREWSYLEGVELGFLTKDPSQVHDPDVCAPYITATPAA